MEVDENTPLNINKREHIYTSSKVAAESLIQSYSELYDQDFTILRYGIPYGPRARGGTVLPIFVRLASEGKPLTIQGDGSAHRKFIYVEDIARANALAISDNACNEVLNLEGPRNISVKEVADIVNDLFDGKVEINYVDARPAIIKVKRFLTLRLKSYCIGLQRLISLKEQKLLQLVQRKCLRY